MLQARFSWRHFKLWKNEFKLLNYLQGIKVKGFTGTETMNDREYSIFRTRKSNSEVNTPARQWSWMFWFIYWIQTVQMFNVHCSHFKSLLSQLLIKICRWNLTTEARNTGECTLSTLPGTIFLNFLSRLYFVVQQNNSKTSHNCIRIKSFEGGP